MTKRKRRKKIHPVRFLFRLLMTAILAVALYFGSVSLAILYVWKTSEGAKSDTIIVLGAAVWNGRPSPALLERIEVASDAWNRQLAPRIIATGGIGLPGEPSEAATIKKTLTARGVPSDAVLTEDTSRNTYENLQYSKDLMEISGMDSAVLVTHGYHALRAKLMAGMLGIDASVEAVQIQPKRLLYYTLRECGGIAYLAAKHPISFVKFIVSSINPM